MSLLDFCFCLMSQLLCEPMRSDFETRCFMLILNRHITTTSINGWTTSGTLSWCRPPNSTSKRNLYGFVHTAVLCIFPCGYFWHEPSFVSSKMYRKQESLVSIKGRYLKNWSSAQNIFIPPCFNNEAKSILCADGTMVLILYLVSFLMASLPVFHQQIKPVSTDNNRDR